VPFLPVLLGLMAPACVITHAVPGADGALPRDVPAAEGGLDALDVADAQDAQDVQLPDVRVDGGCPTGLSACSGACVDLTVDVRNCGRCGGACPAGMICSAGNCGCPSGLTACSGTCRDLTSDPNNCSTCDHVCTAANATGVCTAGACTLACAAGWADCDMISGNGCEADLSQVAHCGACANACANRANAARACTGGACTYTCDAGFGDCDGDPANGCEAALAADTANCGGCGRACTPQANQTAACAGGTCSFACAAGFGDCDRTASNGCEADLGTSDTNCGSCGTRCPGAHTCMSGICAL
jgi:hypothetical protein